MTFDLSLEDAEITLEDLPLNLRPITIDASSLDSLTMHGRQLSSVVAVHADSVVLVGLTITGGQSETHGGGIYNKGDLTLRDCYVVGNTAAQYGGGIYNHSGTMTIEQSTISHNQVSRYGAALYSREGEISITGSTFEGNIDVENKGVIDVDYEITLTMSQSVVRENIGTALHNGNLYRRNL